MVAAVVTPMATSTTRLRSRCRPSLGLGAMILVVALAWRRIVISEGL